MKKVLPIIILSLILVLPLCAADAQEGSLRTVYFYDPEVEPYYSTPMNCLENELAGTFSFDEGFCTAFTLRTGPTWNYDVNSVDIVFYEWAGDYYNTVGGESIASCRIVNHIDNASYDVAFDTPLPAGKYLWRFENAVSDIGHLGLWLDSDCAGIDTYIDGELSDGDFHVSITLDMTPVSTRPADTYDGTTIMPYVTDASGAQSGGTQRVSMIKYLSSGGAFTLSTLSTVLLIISGVFILTAVLLYLLRIVSTKNKESK